MQAKSSRSSAPGLNLRAINVWATLPDPALAGSSASCFIALITVLNRRSNNHPRIRRDVKTLRDRVRPDAGVHA